MKIGIDVRTLMDAKYSGVNEYTFNLIKEIIKLDSHSTGSGQSENEYRLFYNSATKINNPAENFAGHHVRVVKKNYPNKILNYILFKFFNWPKIDKMLDVDFFFMPHINFISLSRKCKGILTVHDLSFLRYPEFFNWRKNFWHRMINVRKLVRRLDHVVAISENTKKDIIELCGVSPEKVSVIYSGLGEEFRVVDGSDVNLKKIKDKYILPDKFILYLGTLEPRKNIEGLIMAYKQFRDKGGDRECKLVIAGARGWKTKKIFKTQQDSGYQNDIKFIDYVDRDDRVYLYNLASVFVYPSFYEGFGFPPLEAMACGVPTVTSMASSLSEAVDDASIMIDPYNISDITSSIEVILSDSDVRNSLIAKGINRAKEFSWQKTASEYLNLFNKKMER